MNNIYIFVLGLINVVILMLIYKKQLKKIGIIEDIQTSSNKGVPVGLVEIKGTVKNENPQKTFLL